MGWKMLTPAEEDRVERRNKHNKDIVQAPQLLAGQLRDRTVEMSISISIL
jgi:hypothetical protein